jgi:hypothetical protein
MISPNTGSQRIRHSSSVRFLSSIAGSDCRVYTHVVKSGTEDGARCHPAQRSLTSSPVNQDLA